jgi:hypothetical protein
MPAHVVEPLQMPAPVEWMVLEGGPMVPLEGHAVFVLPPDFNRLIPTFLGSVYETMHAALLSPQLVEAGFAYRDLRSVPAASDLSEFHGRGGLSEVRVRSLKAPFQDGPTGLLVRANRGFDVSPGLEFAVAWEIDEVAAAEWARKRASRGSEEGEVIEVSGTCGGLFQIELLRRDVPKKVLARGLTWPASVVSIDRRAVRFLFRPENEAQLRLGEAPVREDVGLAVVRGRDVGRVIRTTSCTSGPYFVGVGTYLVEEERWVDVRVSDRPTTRDRQFFPGRRRILTRCWSPAERAAKWCSFDLDDLSRTVVFPVNAPHEGSPPFPLLLRSGGLAIVSGTAAGDHWRLAVYDEEAREVGVLSIDGTLDVRLAGELSDGSIAVARRKSGSDERFSAAARWPYQQTTAGWSVETIVVQQQLELRPLASDLLNSGADRLFVDRTGRAVLVTAEGMTDALSGELILPRTAQR